MADPTFMANSFPNRGMNTCLAIPASRPVPSAPGENIFHPVSTCPPTIYKNPDGADWPDQEFAALDKYPAICGEFVWTGFDYLGEPTPFNSDASVLLNHAGSRDKKLLEEEQKKLEEIEKKRPTSRSSYFGIVDLAGFPKDRYYLYQSRWRPELPMVHILPHWNWKERKGQKTPYLSTPQARKPNFS